MSPPMTPSKISVKDFTATLERYQSHVSEKLRELDEFRLVTLPSRLAERNRDGCWMEKDEVEKLVEWKLKHGTYRPNLLLLVQSNPSPLITDTTRTAFTQLPTTPQTALKTLCALKGIGPATASLLLSTLDPARTPFFSDELYRWLHWEDEGPKSKGAGWERRIGYTAKEYGSLVERIGGVLERLEVRAVDVEMVAFVLGREGVDVAGGSGEEAEEKAGAKEKDVEEKADTERKGGEGGMEDMQDGKKRKAGKAGGAASRAAKKSKIGGEKEVVANSEEAKEPELSKPKGGRTTRSGKTS